MPAVEAWGQNLVYLQQFGTVYALTVISRVNILTTKATINYSYLDLPRRFFFFYHGINPRDVVRGQNSLIYKFF